MGQEKTVDRENRVLFPQSTFSVSPHLSIRNTQKILLGRRDQAEDRSQVSITVHLMIPEFLSEMLSCAWKTESSDFSLLRLQISLKICMHRGA